MFETPNIDSMTPQELKDFVIGNWQSPSPECRQVALYARFRLKAMALRKQGFVFPAEQIERDMGYIYRNLPSDWRW